MQQHDTTGDATTTLPTTPSTTQPTTTPTPLPRQRLQHSPHHRHRRLQRHFHYDANLTTLTTPTPSLRRRHHNPVRPVGSQCTRIQRHCRPRYLRRRAEDVRALTTPPRSRRRTCADAAMRSWMLYTCTRAKKNKIIYIYIYIYLISNQETRYEISK